MGFLADAIKLSVEHHFNQKYDNQSFIEGHILPVVLQAEVICVGIKMSSTEVEVVKAIAHLHDVVEDTNCSMNEIKSIHRIPDAVTNGVEALTYDKNTPLGMYLGGIVKCSIYAIIVRLADSMCNLRKSLSTGHVTGILKYSGNINFLSAALVREIEKRKN